MCQYKKAIVCIKNGVVCLVQMPQRKTKRPVMAIQRHQCSQELQQIVSANPQ
jgi:hypothetical protein